MFASNARNNFFSANFVHFISSTFEHISLVVIEKNQRFSMGDKEWKQINLTTTTIIIIQCEVGWEKEEIN